MRPRPSLFFLPSRSAERTSEGRSRTRAREEASAQAAELYDSAARAAARTVIKRYSSSFSLASSVLPRAVRTHIEAVYAVVRVADEIVDGAWPEAPAAQVRAELDAFEERIAHAAETGFSSDLIAHAFARTARRTGISAAQWSPFFASMRVDAPSTEAVDPGPAAPAFPAAAEPVPEPQPAPLPAPDLSAYIHGSAEVVGEMCVLAFFDGAPLPPDAEQTLMPGARALGSAFQKVNFLRDLAHDSEGLSRSYLTSPGRAAAEFTEEAKHRLVEEIFTELATASEAVDLLPPPVRPAVWTAYGIFGELTHRLAGTPVDGILARRVRVPGPVKLRYAARATAGRPVRTWPSTPVRCTTTPSGHDPEHRDSDRHGSERHGPEAVDSSPRP
ncbi:phytoene/squalene synthase family protein [Brevibacterium album]|uniref:phytoene/squalene synthase family protein n=1 Tax=Brevibacterium album TaxID=417948 RepID=UPI000411F632|nr:squalene/phytoene synthase family protein [Brevibacterium album]